MPDEPDIELDIEDVEALEAASTDEPAWLDDVLDDDDPEVIGAESVEQ